MRLGVFFCVDTDQVEFKHMIMVILKRPCEQGACRSCDCTAGGNQPHAVYRARFSAFSVFGLRESTAWQLIATLNNNDMVCCAAFVHTSRWVDNEKLVHRAAKTLENLLLSARKRQRYARMLVEAQTEVTDTDENDQAILLEVEVELRRREEASRKEEAEEMRKQEAEKANVQAEGRRQREKTEAHAIAKAIAEAEAERVAMHAQSKQTSKSMSDEAGIKTRVESAVSAGFKSEKLRNEVRLSKHVPMDHENGEGTGLGQATSETAENLKRQAPSTPSTKRRVNIHVPVSMKSSEEDFAQLSADAALALLNQLCHVDQSQPATDNADSQMYQTSLRSPQSEASSTCGSDPKCMLEQSSQFGGVYKREQRRQTAVAVCGMRNRSHDFEAREADCRMRNRNHDAAGSEFDVFRRTASDGAVLQGRARGSARPAAGPGSLSPGRHAQQHGAGPEGQHFARLVHLSTPPSNVLSPFLMLQCL